MIFKKIQDQIPLEVKVRLVFGYFNITEAMGISSIAFLLYFQRDYLIKTHLAHH